MKNIPKVLILGRPNVGKSTLINQILGKNKAITYDTPGVTRDLAYFPAQWEDKHFMIIDSGGIWLGKTHDTYLQNQVEDQVKSVIKTADKIIFLTDGMDGLHPIDKVIAKALRPYSKKVSIVINKVDNEKIAQNTTEFYKLGLGKPFSISALQKSGLKEFLESLTIDFMGTTSAKQIRQESYKIALVGRPNVGKSSLINSIINEQRVLVDDIAGTTRDAIEVYFNQGNNTYTFIDTAGLRKRTKVKDSIEFYSTVRSKKSILEADLVILVLDVNDFLNNQDKKILSQILDARKSFLIFVNKWDSTERSDEKRKELVKQACYEIPTLENFPFIFGSAKEKQNIGKLFNEIPKIITDAQTRIPTGELNRFIHQIFSKNPPPSKKGKRIKIYYGTQAESYPPIFIFFINQPKLLDADYVRFVEKRLREHVHKFYGTPVQLYFKSHKDDFKSESDRLNNNA